MFSHYLDFFHYDLLFLRLAEINIDNLRFEELLGSIILAFLRILIPTKTNAPGNYLSFKCSVDWGVGYGFYVKARFDRNIL